MLKRGQATVFVVLGILAVTAIVLLIAYRQDIFASDFEQARETALVVPEKAQEVQSLVQKCIEQVSEQGLTILGTQGGYINLPSDTLVTPAHPFSTSLPIFENSDLKTAYWFYVAPNGVQKNGIPTLKQMETDLAEYVRQNLGSCVQNFTMFETYNVTAGPIAVDLSINPRSVLVTADFPLKIDLYGFEYEVTRFYAEVNSRVGEMYAVGKEIMQKENADLYLEDKTIDLLSVYEDIPYSRTEITCSPRLWTKSKVLSAIKSAAANNMQFIKVKGTETSSSDKYFLWDALQKSHSGITAGFRYSKQWPMKMDVYPSEGEILKAEPINKVNHPAVAYLTSLFCLTDYNFVYDLKYPVLVSLTDENGNMFQFATMVVISKNQPRENKIQAVEIPEETNQICKNAINPVTVYALSPDADGNLIPLEGADIKLKCITSVCDLGTTKINRDSGDALLKVRAPQCVNAQLIAEKEGYHEGKEIVSTVESGSYNVMIEPYNELSYEIKIMDQGVERDMVSGETAIITIDNEEKGYSRTISDPGGKISLIAGDFNIRSTLIAQGFDIPIEGKEITHCYQEPSSIIFGIFGITNEKCTTVKSEDMTLDQVITGGAEQAWSVDRQEMSAAKKVTFYIPSSNLPSSMEELEQVYKDVSTSNRAVRPFLE